MVRPVGMLDLIEGDEVDHKVLAVPTRHPTYDSVRGLADVFQHVLTEVQHFFKIYKELEGSTAVVKGWRDVADAGSVIRAARERHLAKKSRKT